MIDKMVRWEGSVGAEVVEMWDWAEAMVICEEGVVEGVTNRGMIELVI